MNKKDERWWKKYTNDEKWQEGGRDREIGCVVSTASLTINTARMMHESIRVVLQCSFNCIFMKSMFKDPKLNKHKTTVSIKQDSYALQLYYVQKNRFEIRNASFPTNKKLG